MKKRIKKQIIVSVTNDLVSDNRVHKVCQTLHHMGFSVLLVGRKLPGSLPLGPRVYPTKRLRLLFKKGPFFYACYNFRFLLFLLFSKFDVLLSNDLDTLPANFLASRFKGKPLVYDSHEFFTEVPELVCRPRVKRIWEWLEKKMLPEVRSAYTVCNSIAQIYNQKYGTTFQVVRNFPMARRSIFDEREEKKTSEKMILYQGAVNVHRGLEQAIHAMKFVEGALLVIAGDGDIKSQLEYLVQKEGLQHKVRFSGRLPIDELARLTRQADVGLSIEEDVGLNYRYALPNKLFDYIQAQVPVLVTNLPEMAAIVNRYQIGEVTDSLHPEVLAGKMKEMLFNEADREKWGMNLELAAAELTWENEEKKLVEIFKPFM